MNWNTIENRLSNGKQNTNCDIIDNELFSWEGTKTQRTAIE